MNINQALSSATLRIKGNLLRNNTTGRLKSIMVTSANHGEGTSYLVASLAFAFALGGTSRVLIVDANLRRPSLHSLFGIESEKGFLDYIGGSSDLAASIKESSFSNIKVMTAGEPSDDDILPSLAALSQDTKNSIEMGFDWILYNTPPLNYYPDTLMATVLADGVILIMLAGKTSCEGVKKAKRTLESVEATILGAVLNKGK